MEEKTRYKLGKDERLKSRKAIEQLFADGKSFSLFPFKVIYKNNGCTNIASTINRKPQTGNLQAAFSVSKRHFKKATERNRIKRLMREAWRLQKNEWQTSLQQTNKTAVVFILYVSNELPQEKFVFEKINAALKKLQRINNEEAPGNL